MENKQGLSSPPPASTLGDPSGEGGDTTGKPWGDPRLVGTLWGGDGGSGRGMASRAEESWVVLFALPHSYETETRPRQY